jgi:hypothetical protein
MAYTPTYGTPGPTSGWADGPGGGTPETAAALDNIEQGLVDAHAALATLPTAYASKTGPNTFVGQQTLPSAVIGTQSLLTEVPGSNGERISLQNLLQATGTQGAPQLQMVPDANAISSAGSMAEILLMNKTGQGYERFTLNFVNDAMVIATSANGLGIPRSMVFQTGEWDPLNIGGINAMVIHGDGSIDLNGAIAIVTTPIIPAAATVASVVNGVSATLSTPVLATAEWLPGTQANVVALLPAGRTVTCVATAGSAVLTGNFLAGDAGAAISSQITYGNSRTRICDPFDVGKSALVIDTHSTTPVGASGTDIAWVEYRQGGNRKWSAGLNAGGGNANSLDFVNAVAAVLLEVRQNGNIGLGLTAGQNALFANGVGVVGLSDATTAPTTTPTGGGNLFSTAGTLKWRGSGGGTTTLANAAGGIPDGVNGTDAATLEQTAMGAFFGKPTGAQFETFPRAMAPAVAGAGTALAAGVLTMCAVYLPKGTVVSNISAKSGTTAAVTPTNCWFGLYDSSRVQLATTADQTTTPWAASTLMTKPIAATAAGAASSFTTTYAGLHYIGVMMAAATPITILGTVTANALTGLLPVLCGPSSVAQTAPPAFPFTAAGITASSNPFYAYV